MKLSLDAYMFRDVPLELPGLVNACGFAWEERAREASTFLREKITDLPMKQGMQL